MKKILALLLCLTAVSFVRVPNPDFKVVEENNIVIKSKYLTAEGYEAPFNVILPADYKTSGKKYPVLYLLHGMTDDNNAWQEGGNLVALTEEAVRAGVIQPFIIVLPNAYLTFYVDGLNWSEVKVPVVSKMPTLSYESFFVKELQPYIEKHYPVRTDREHTAIAGLSMGGYGASYHAFKYPEKYSFCASFSGAVDGGDWTGLTDRVPSIEDVFAEKGYEESNFDTLPQYIMDCGREDAVCGTFNVDTHAFLKRIEFPHTFRSFPGIHDWPYWQKAYVRMLPELAEHFNK